MELFEKLHLEEEDLPEFFDLIDLDGGGSVDETELSQVFLQLKSIAEDPTWIALLRS